MTSFFDFCFQKGVAEASGHEITWLKNLYNELISEGICEFHSYEIGLYLDWRVAADNLNIDLIDRLLIARLELNPQSMRCVTEGLGRLRWLITILLQR